MEAAKRSQAEELDVKAEELAARLRQQEQAEEAMRAQAQVLGTRSWALYLRPKVPI